MKKKLNSNLLFLVWFVSSLFSPPSLSVLPVRLVLPPPPLGSIGDKFSLAWLSPTPISNFKFQMHFTFFIFLFRIYFSPFHGLTLESVFLSFFAAPAFSLLFPQLDCPHPSWFSERLPSIFCLASALELIPPPSANPFPSPSHPIARSGLWGPVARSSSGSLVL